MNAVTAKVAAAFDAAAGTYEQAASLQREVAQALADRIRALSLPHNPRILEIGCGTGFLTQALAGIGGDIIATDISEAMARRCTTPARVVMDGELPCFGRSFDLICSSLAFQWFGDLPRALAVYASMLRGGGYLAFATLGEGTFAEWDATLDQPQRRYPSRARLQAALPQGRIEQHALQRHYRSGRDFLHRLKMIGAHRSSPAMRPMSAGSLRRVLRRFDAGLTVTYNVLYATLQT